MKNYMLFMGTQLVSEVPEVMAPITPEDLVHKIKTDQELKLQVEELVRAKAIDVKAYKKLKTRLPYIVSSTFESSIRHTDRFTYAQYWILDLDSCLSTPAADLKLKEKIKNDPATMMMFGSPGGEGLKILFQLEPECTSVIDFALAYKSFATRFAEKLELEGVVDLRTSDVSRACFLSYDPDAYYCPMPQLIEWRTFLPERQPEVAVTAVKATPVVDREILTNIRQVLNPQTVVRQQDRQVYQPSQIKEMEERLTHAVAGAGMSVEKVLPLNYGVKLSVRQDIRSGEINVFYGKKGFSLVISPKSGTSPEVNQLLYRTIAALLFPGD